MKILCPIKRVIDYQVKIRVKSDHSGVETNNVAMGINPFDAIAMEEAVRGKEQGLVKEITVVTIGSQDCVEILRKALAHGADRAILIEKNTPTLAFEVAHCLANYVAQYQPDCVLLGKQAIDDDSNQTGQYLAGLLGWPQAMYASKIEFLGKTAQVTRECDHGLEIVKLTLPAVISADLRLNQPRYLSLPSIIKAKQKPLDMIPYASLSSMSATCVQVVSVSAPAPRQKGMTVESVAELLNYLHDKEALLS